MDPIPSGPSPSSPATSPRKFGSISVPHTLHFHMHDGHSLNRGISDHLSFLNRLPIPFDYKGRRSLAMMFGPTGLARIASRSLETSASRRVTFTLEIHPTEDRLAMDDAAAELFTHWADKTNAERMNHWLLMLSENQKVLTRFLRAALADMSRSDHKDTRT